MTATITLYPEYAALVRAGVKWIETRPGPSYGPGKVPGLSVKPGDRLLIHAGMRLPKGVGRWWVGSDNYGFPRLSDGEQSIKLRRGRIVASCVLRDCVPIVEYIEDLADSPAAVEARSGSHTLPLRFWPQGADHDHETTDISDQYPLGDFTPGRWAWLLDDVKPTTERCPACWTWDRWQTLCPVCDGRVACPPIPAKGRQGIWRWEP